MEENEIHPAVATAADAENPAQTESSPNIGVSDDQDPPKSGQALDTPL